MDPYDLIDPDTNRLRQLTYKQLRDLDPETLRLFLHFTARYVFPTTELIDWLKDYIGDRSAIEVGSGCGDLGRQLGIRMTDNYCQTRPDVVFAYQAMQQPLIKYGADVEKIDALDAAKKYKPDVIVGAWVTHWIDPNKPPPKGGGNMYGLKEKAMLRYCKEYIVVGSVKIHKHKPIMKLRHQTIDASDFVVSRSQQQDDRIWIWKGWRK